MEDWKLKARMLDFGEQLKNETDIDFQTLRNVLFAFANAAIGLNGEDTPFRVVYQHVNDVAKEVLGIVDVEDD